MKKGFFCRLVVILTVLSVMLQPFYVRAGTLDQIRSIAKSVLSGEPEEVEELRQMEVAQSEEGHQEYYFKQLNEEEQRVYRELLKGCLLYTSGNCSWNSRFHRRKDFSG